ncbi:unnamed protein product [Caenorhabditis brenneri]
MDNKPFNATQDDHLLQAVALSFAPQRMQDGNGLPLSQAVGQDPNQPPQPNSFMLGQNGNNLPLGTNHPMPQRFAPYVPLRRWTPADTEQLFNDFMGQIGNANFGILSFCANFRAQHGLQLRTEGVKDKLKAKIRLFFSARIEDDEDLELRRKIGRMTKVQIPPDVLQEYRNKMIRAQNSGGGGPNADQTGYQPVPSQADGIITASSTRETSVLSHVSGEIPARETSTMDSPPTAASRRTTIKAEPDCQLNATIKEERVVSRNRPLKVPETDAYTFLFVVITALEKLNSVGNKDFKQFLEGAAAKMNNNISKLYQKKLNHTAIRFEFSGILGSEFSKEDRFSDGDGFKVIGDILRVPTKVFLEAVKVMTMGLGPVSTQLGAIREAIDTKIGTLNGNEETLMVEILEAFKTLIERYV